MYPRAAGYVHRWLVDIGDRVKEGQLLAEIDTPRSTRRSSRRARSSRRPRRASFARSTSAELSKTKLDRYETLTPAGVASRQELDQRRAQAKVDQANVKVAARDRRVAAGERAPAHAAEVLFAGARAVRAARSCRARSSAARSCRRERTPLFKLAAVDPVRVFVQVPQDVAPSVRPGQLAHVAVREYAGRKFEGAIARAAGALDDASRTMTTEVRVPNPKGELLPGMYVEVALTLPTPHRLYEVPATALFNDSQGTRVAVVDAQNKIAMRKIGIERDTGSLLLVSTGLDGSERIVKLASAVLGSGVAVEVIATPRTPGP